CHFGCAESAQSARGACPQTGREKTPRDEVLSGACNNPTENTFGGDLERDSNPRKERSDGIAIAARSADRAQCGVRSVISAAPKARKARRVHVPKQGE